MDADYFILDDGRGVMRIEGVCYTKVDGMLRILYCSGDHCGHCGQSGKIAKSAQNKMNNVEIRSCERTDKKGTAESWERTDEKGALESWKRTDEKGVEEAWKQYQQKINRLQVLAESIARDPHKGQKDKAGADYILHPLAVAAMCPNTETRVVALLHDTIEDTYVTADLLREKGFPEYIVNAVLLVTKEKGFDEEKYFTRISRNSLACTVKMADLMNNMDPTRMKVVTDEDITRQGKYRREFRFLFTHESKCLTMIYFSTDY